MLTLAAPLTACRRIMAQRPAGRTTPAGTGLVPYTRKKSPAARGAAGLSEPL